MRRLAVALLAAVAYAGRARAAQPPVTLDNTACAAFGNKRPGTKADRGMADLIESRFKAAGLDTRVETFNLPSLELAATRIEQNTPAKVQGFSTDSGTDYYHTTEDTPDKINSAGHVRVTPSASCATPRTSRRERSAVRRCRR